MVGIDYGTSNATAYVLVGVVGTKYYVIKEYYYSGRESQAQKSDLKYSQDLQKFVEGYDVHRIFLDPSAASFRTQLKDDGVTGILDADHDVLNGIRSVYNKIDKGELFVHESCKNLRREFSSYAWDPKCQKLGEDKPLKENDHMLDSLRYTIQTDSKRNFTIY